MKAYTLIELIIAIVLLSIAMLGIALLFMEDTRASVYSRNLIQAENLARLEAAKVENTAFGSATLADGYNNTTAAYESYPLDLNRRVAMVAGTNNKLKKVTISLYPTGATDTIVQVITYKANVVYGKGSGGGAAAIGIALDISGGSISGENLSGIAMENTGSGEITVAKVRVTFTGASGIKLSTITMDGAEKWSGSKSSGSEITLTAPFVMSGSTSYSNCSFGFSKAVSTVTVNYYELSDGDQSNSYSWP